MKVDDAIQHPLKICKATDEEIITAMAYCFAATGLPDTSIPKGLHRGFLIEFIKDNYKFYSVEEIKTAFTMAVKGELDFVKKDGDIVKVPKHYNNFCPDYFGSVMASYKREREKACVRISNERTKRKPEEVYIPTGIERIKIQHEYDEMILNPMYEKYKQTKSVDLGYTTAKMVYDSLVGFHKVKTFSNDDKRKIKESALERIKMRNEEIKNSKARNYQEYKNKMKRIDDFMEREDEAEKQVINECYLICIKQCFDVLIERKTNRI